VLARTKLPFAFLLFWVGKFVSGGLGRLSLRATFGEKSNGDYWHSMKSQDFLLVVVGAAIGAAIGTGAIYYFSFYQQIVAPRERLAERLMAVEEMETVRVLVAKETLSAGMLLDTNDLQ
jgi:hypothetical protein